FPQRASLPNSLWGRLPTCGRMAFGQRYAYAAPVGQASACRGLQPANHLEIRPSFLALLVLASLPAFAQQSLQQIEAQARQLTAHGDAAGALAEWQKAESLDPKSARVQHEIGFLLAVLQRQPEAVTHLERAVELDPKLAVARYHLGVAYWLQQDA